MEDTLPPLESIVFVDECQVTDSTISPILQKPNFIISSPNYDFIESAVKFDVSYEWRVMGTIMKSAIGKVNGVNSLGFIFTEVPSHFIPEFCFCNEIKHCIDSNYYINDENSSLLFDPEYNHNMTRIRLILESDMKKHVIMNPPKSCAITVNGNDYEFKGIYIDNTYNHSLKFYNTVVDLKSITGSVDSLMSLNLTDSTLTEDSKDIKLKNCFMKCFPELLGDAMAMMKKVRVDFNEEAIIYIRYDGRLMLRTAKKVVVSKIENHSLTFIATKDLSIYSDSSKGFAPARYIISTLNSDAIIKIGGKFEENNETQIIVTGTEFTTIIASATYLPIELTSRLTYFDYDDESNNGTIRIGHQKLFINYSDMTFSATKGYYTFDSIDAATKATILVSPNHFSVDILTISSNITIHSLIINHLLIIQPNYSLRAQRCNVKDAVIIIEVIPGNCSGFLKYASMPSFEAIPEEIIIRIRKDNITSNKAPLVKQIIAEFDTDFFALRFSNLVRLEKPIFRYDGRKIAAKVFCIDTKIYIDYGPLADVKKDNGLVGVKLDTLLIILGCISTIIIFTTVIVLVLFNRKEFKINPKREFSSALNTLNSNH